MPLCQISLRAGKPESYRRAICDSLYQAMRESLNVPEDDQFMTVTEHDAANFRHGSAYGVTRSADLVYFRIITFDGRAAEKKLAFFEKLAELLADNPGIRSEDVFVNIVESPRENWWAGHSLAQPA
ncbi:tautomerase family protein [Denitrobaculum tricleocarpae]|uniref:Tautomerase family protein n=1 Tax=Denitrobaculum tricleocarpae TaxID=2591009 RepID=A0A545TXA6_9PROT|nr:tautomerase family protein [Denitrobaculum tricleocarpae]TQV81830.1 tautomerase family protein [Denitrobaculum tricleocarpae]